MKKLFMLSMAALMLSVIVVGCRSGRNPMYSNPEAYVVGEDYGFKLLGLIPIVRADYSDAMGDLYRKANIPAGRNVMLSKVTVNRFMSQFYLAFSITKATVEAELIDLDGVDYEIISPETNGTSYGFMLLGVISMVPPSYGGAVDALYENNSVKDKNKYLLTQVFIEDSYRWYFLAFSIPRITVKGQLIKLKSMPKQFKRMKIQPPKKAKPAPAKAKK